ncbi:MAG: stage II sporulation protein M [archaeon]
MVLEHIFPENWLERRAIYGFLLGVMYSVIGIAMAAVLFPGDPSLVSVAFVALLMLPELYKLFSIEERMEEQEKRFSFRRLFLDNKDFVKTYLMITLGIFLVYSIASILLPSFQVNQLFRDQLELRDLSGGAIFIDSLFYKILLNNWWVLLACFFVSLLTGDGAIFLITWNASLWGTIFGVTARNAAAISNVSPFWVLLLVLLIVGPHALIEILAYILAAISGGVISKDVLLERFDSQRFWEVFRYNFMLFLLAVIILIIGAVVETYVLGNSVLYMTIIAQSYMML